jgi:rare lipoprotein A
MTFRKIVYLVVFFVVKSGFLYGQQVPLGTEIVGMASYYGTKFYGNKTSSGEILDKDELTCAHPTLPFGTMLEVSNLANNKWCVVRVNDRGPYSHGRLIDVTHKAAKILGMFSSGVAKVKVTIVGDHRIVYISRPEAVIENSMDLVKDEEEIQIPLKNETRVEKGIEKAKRSKSITKKRAARKKRN